MAPHVSLVKLTWPFGDKKAKAAVNKLAGQAQLHRSKLPCFQLPGIDVSAGGAGAGGGVSCANDAKEKEEQEQEQENNQKMGENETASASAGAVVATCPLVVELLAIDGPHAHHEHANSLGESYYVPHGQLII